MSCYQRFNPLIPGAFQSYLFRKSAKSRRSYALRSAGIFPVLGQILGQGSDTTSKFAPDINKKGTNVRKSEQNTGEIIATNHKGPFPDEADQGMAQRGGYEKILSLALVEAQATHFFWITALHKPGGSSIAVLSESMWPEWS